MGNQNGEDGFGIGDASVYLDLSALSRIYGDAKKAGQPELLDRLFAHEYTHVLQTVWERTRPLPVATPLDRAPRQLWREGLGNMYSLDAKGVSPKGVLTPKARAS